MSLNVLTLQFGFGSSLRDTFNFKIFEVKATNAIRCSLYVTNKHMWFKYYLE